MARPRFGSMRKRLGAATTRVKVANARINNAIANLNKRESPRRMFRSQYARFGRAGAAIAEGKARGEFFAAEASLNRIKRFRSSALGKAIRVATSPKLSKRLLRRR